MAVLVIGIGGLGRGVCNWLKQRLEHEYGSPAAAGFRLFVVDGPREDNQYVLPGGYQIDTSPKSTEFYALTELPGPAIQAVAKGDPYPFVDTWLTAAEAQHIPNPARIIPSTGYGQVRPAGRVGFFLEANKLQPILKDLVAGKDAIVLTGSQSGGTGSGMLLDVAQIIRSVKPVDAPFHGYIALPAGFRHVFGDGQSLREGNTRGFAGMRELERQRVSPNVVEYCPGVTVTNDTVFDGCFIVDGQGPGSADLNTVPPIYGVSPAIADHILCLYGTPIAGANAANWTQHSTIHLPETPAEPGYWSAGVYTYLYDWKALEGNFAFRFARAVYDALLTVDPEEANKGSDLASSVLRTTGPGGMALELSTKGALTIKWPELNQPESLTGLLTLRSNLNTRGPENTPGPIPPYAQVIDWIETDRLFRRVDNADVIAQCSAFTKRHVGTPQDPPNPNPDATLWGWLNYQHSLVCREFVVQLCGEVQELFYDTQQGDWRALSQRPYSLMIARDLLQACRGLLGSELNFVTGVLAAFGEQKVMARADNVRGQAAQDLLDQPRNGQVQRAYVEGPYQWCHELEEWQALARGYEATLRDMIGLTDDLWRKIGQPADGWIGYLQDGCRQQVEDMYNADLTARQKAQKEVQARSYVPQPGGLAEQTLYRQLVDDNEHLQALLGQLAWQFKSTLAQPGVAFSPTVDTAAIAASFDCYLRTPQVLGYTPSDEQAKGLYDGVDGGYRQTIIHRHQPELFVQVGRNNCEPLLRSRDVWDILALEAAAANIDPETYAGQIQSTLLSRSQRALDLRGSATPVENAYEVTQHNAASPISTAVAKGLTDKEVGGAGLVPGTPFQYSVAVARAAVRLSLDDWSDYPTTRDDYFACRKALPVHCYPEERIATEHIEEYLLQHHKVAVRDLPLHYTVCRHLTDWEAFQAFAVCYLLLGKPLPTAIPLADTGGGPAARRLEVPKCSTGGGHSTSCDLGLACNMDGVLANLMKRDTLSEKARNMVKAMRSELASQAQSDPTLKTNLDGYLKPQEPGTIVLPELDQAVKEELNRPHLQWALWAAVWQYAEGVLGI